MTKSDSFLKKIEVLEEQHRTIGLNALELADLKYYRSCITEKPEEKIVNPALEALRKLKGIEIWIEDNDKKEFFKSIVYPVLKFYDSKTGEACADIP